MINHKNYDRNRALVTCPGPFKRFTIESAKEEDMKKTPTESNRNRLGSTGSARLRTISSSENEASSANISLNIDVKIDFVKTIKEMKER